MEGFKGSNPPPPSLIHLIEMDFFSSEKSNEYERSRLYKKKSYLMFAKL